MLWLWPWASSRDPVLCSALTPGPSLWGQTAIPGRLVPATGVKLLVGAPSECLIPVSALTRLSQHPGRQQAILGSSIPAQETQVEFWPPGSGLVQPFLLLSPGSELVEGRPLSMSLQNKMKISRKLKSRNAFRKTDLQSYNCGIWTVGKNLEMDGFGGTCHGPGERRRIPVAWSHSWDCALVIRA